MLILNTLSIKIVSVLRNLYDNQNMNNECKDFWQRVNSLIKQLHTKQETVANDCGINYQTFRGWIVHETYPNAKQSVLIANRLGTTVEYLVTGKEILDEDFKEAYKQELIKTLTNILK